jgi:hypothetical protein
LRKSNTSGHYFEAVSTSIGQTIALQTDQTATTTAGVAIEAILPQRVFHAKVVGTGAVTATVIVEVSLDNSTWNTAGTITLSGTTSAADGFVMSAPWRYTRARISAISGTGATVNCWMGS